MKSQKELQLLSDLFLLFLWCFYVIFRRETSKMFRDSFTILF